VAGIQKLWFVEDREALAAGMRSWPILLEWTFRTPTNRFGKHQRSACFVQGIKEWKS